MSRSMAPIHATLLEQLDDLPPARVREALAEVAERVIAYPSGSAEAEEAAVLAGLKPVLRQGVRPDRLDGTRRRLEGMGLVVAHAAPAPRLGLTGHLLFAGRDGDRVQRAAACERRAGAGHERQIGELLGYPACCVEAFVSAPPPRSNAVLARAALASTRDRCQPRLNMLDMGVFHYVSWQPCAFDCVASLAYADAVADILRHRHGQVPGGAGRAAAQCPPGCQHERFVEAIDRVLAAHRLWLADDVQVSLTGRWSEGALEIEDLWPTARDRRPDTPLSPAAREAVARLLVALRQGRRLRVDAGSVQLDDRLLIRGIPVMLVPFGASNAGGRGGERPTSNWAPHATWAAQASLPTRILSADNRPRIVREFAELLAAESAEALRFAGLPVRVAFRALDAFRPSWAREFVDGVLDDWIEALAPLYTRWCMEGRSGDFSAKLETERHQVVDDLLAVAERRFSAGPRPLAERIARRVRPGLRAHLLEAVTAIGHILDEYVEPPSRHDG